MNRAIALSQYISAFFCGFLPNPATVDANNADPKKGEKSKQGKDSE